MTEAGAPAAHERWTVVASWYCLPETVEPATEFRPRRVYSAYCGAPPGVRCERCGGGP